MSQPTGIGIETRYDESNELLIEQIWR